jgi:biotin-(acetyl-CoA carboxylase) ligase
MDILHSPVSRHHKTNVVTAKKQSSGREERGKRFSSVKNENLRLKEHYQDRLHDKGAESL